MEEQRLHKAFSCIRCFERKVKCDKQSPCSNCVKSKIECIFRVPPAPRRRRKRTQEDLLLARLRKCEDLLKSRGIDIDNPETQSRAASGPVTLESPPLTQPSSQQLSPAVSGTTGEDLIFAASEIRSSGRLIVDQGKSLFVENNLWASLSDEFQQPNEAIAGYSDDDDDDAGTPVEESTEFILGYTPTSNSIQQLHPSPTNIFILWQIYLDNINPMTKFIHYPSFGKTLEQACGQLDNLPRGLEALLFAIYGAAVYTIDDEECEMRLGEPRKILLARYRHATRKALARARFMNTSELVVLQALSLYLFSMRENYDPRTNWTLAGIAVRIAQGMGLHRDGTGLGLSIFETEMRRRLWWQIVVLEGRSAELSGSGRFSDLSSDVLAPTNVNDEDLYPEMKEPPVPQTRPTEMISCLLRIELTMFFLEKQRQKSSIDFESLRLSAPLRSSLEERDATMDELEQRLEDKFLKYCDPSVPIQFMSIIIGRGAINMMRLMAHHPRKWGYQEQLPRGERDYLWNVSVKLLEGTNMAHSSKQLQRFMWHTRVHFVWQALIFVLNDLKQSTLGPEADRGWQAVDEIYRHHPYFVTDYKRPLHVAVGSLCLKAYAAREKALRASTNGVFPKFIPEYIQQLREQRETGPLQRAKAASSKMRSGNARDAVNDAGSSDNQFPTTMGWESISPPTQPTPSHLFSADTAYGTSNASSQLPLPAFQPIIPPPLAGDGIFASEHSLAHDLALADVQLDWAQWDYIMQDMGEIP
ncbi:putative C6 transcription factor [Cladophialophora carrionii]|uniref:Putative C6 transcription factor n=1 Tax=Cladophialophora carrionii TaxID=86049 RepID=A0A1C1CIJ4_9EURO|nr:putative C6 transcription factor [Cladophialophora carrionii]